MSLGKTLATLAGIGIACTVTVVACNAITAPMRSASGVMERTMDSGNVLRTYELFHDRHKGYQARLAQIATSKSNLANETDSAEKYRLRVELNAQQQSCRDIAAGYNSDAAKTNRSIFQGRDLPMTLPMEAC